MIGAFVFEILVAGLLVYGIVRLVRGRARVPDAGLSLRRFLEYGLLGAVGVLAASGLTGLLGEILAGGELIRRDEPGVARSLAFLVVGVPAMLWMGLRVARRLRTDASEQASFALAAYLTLAQAVALVTAMTGAADTLRWVLGEADYRSGAVASAIVWSAVWFAHVAAARRLGVAERLKLAALFGSAVGLVGTAIAFGYGLGQALSYGYDELFRSALAEAPADELRVASAWLLVTVPAWWWHWFRAARSDEPTAVWRVYVLAIGVVSPVVAALAGLATPLFLALHWWMGDPAAAAAGHFAPLPAGLAALAVGTAIWAYHRRLLRPLRRERSELDRTYGYLLAAVGLAAWSVGLAAMVAAGIDAGVGRSGGAAEPSAGDLLATGLTMLLVGAPLWAWHWAVARGHAAADPHGERRSPSRRSYLHLALGGAGAALLTASIAALVIGFEDALAGEFGAESIRQMEAPLAALVVGALVAGYHARVLGDDKTWVSPPDRPVVRDVLLVSADEPQLAARLSTELGVRVRTLRRLEPAAGPVRVEDVLADLRAETHEHIVLVTSAEGGYEVVPVDRL